MALIGSRDVGCSVESPLGAGRKGIEMLLSVVIPCFNRHEMLEACLLSADVQGRQEIEIVLVDDGSDPPLADVVGKHLRSTDKVLRQENRGRGAALREGILAASGKFLLIMDSDDEFLDIGLCKILSDISGDLSSNQIGFVYECRKFDEEKS